jgi:hypothetical protein
MDKTIVIQYIKPCPTQMGTLRHPGDVSEVLRDRGMALIESGYAIPSNKNLRQASAIELVLRQSAREIELIEPPSKGILSRIKSFFT